MNYYCGLPTFMDKSDASFDYENVRSQFFDAARFIGGPHTLSKEVYEETLKQILAAEHNESKFYEIHRENKTYFLIKKRNSTLDPVVKYMCLDDYYSNILNIHLENNHIKGQEFCKRVKNTLKDYYIPVKYIEYIEQFCNVCQDLVSKNKEAARLKGIIAKSAKKVNVTVYIHIYDMSRHEDGNFHYLLICKDCYSCFVWLRPLMEKSSFEVASEIAKIWLSFGAPQKIAVNPIEFEFYVEVLNNLKVLCEGNNVELQKSWTSDSWIRYIVENVLNWMTTTGCSQWSIGCHVAQLQINQKSHFNQKSKTTKTPFQRMFIFSPLDRPGLDPDKDTHRLSGNTINIISDDSDNDHALIKDPEKSTKNMEKLIEDSDNSGNPENSSSSMEIDNPQMVKLEPEEISTYIINDADLDVAVKQEQQPDSLLNNIASQLIRNIFEEFNIGTEESVKNTVIDAVSDKNEIVEEQSGKEESKSEELHLRLEESISDTVNVAMSDKNETAVEQSEQAACKVCRTRIFKSFICDQCSKPVHLYCSARSKLRRGKTKLICFLCLNPEENE